MIAMETADWHCMRGAPAVSWRGNDRVLAGVLSARVPLVWSQLNATSRRLDRSIGKTFGTDGLVGKEQTSRGGNWGSW